MNNLKTHLLLIPKVFFVWLFLCGSSFSQGNDLIAACSQATSIKRLLDSYRGDGSILINAKINIDEIIKINPNCAPAYKELARYHIMSGHINSMKFNQKSLESAEKALLMALKVDPNYADAYVLFGHLYKIMNKHDQAVVSLEKAKIIGTENPWLHLNWADLLLDENRVDEAARHYLIVIESNTSNRKAMGAAFEGLIRYYLNIGALENIDITYQKQIQYEPESAWTYGNYANFLLYYMGDHEKAIKYSRMALERMNYGVGRQILAASLYQKWAYYLVNDNDPQFAQQFFDEAYSIYPDIRRIIWFANKSPKTKLTVDAFRLLSEGYAATAAEK